MEAISTPAIDKVLSLAPATILEVDGFKYIDKNNAATLFKPPTPESIKVHTLSGFVGLLESGFEAFDSEGTIIHVKAFDEVELTGNVSDMFGRRQVYVEAKALRAERPFNFNNYLGQEEFVIALRSMFVQTEDLDKLVAVAGNLSTNAELKQQDDGFSQNATIKTGVVRVAEVTINPRVKLQPFRTFLDVDQPEGEYIFRIKPGNLCALFEADGGRWKQLAMETVQKWLKNNLAGSSNPALGSIPVVA